MIRAFERSGLRQVDSDIVSWCASAAGVDLGGFVSTATIPLGLKTPAEDAYRAVLANLASAVSANWQGTIDQTDTEFLHDLRIALRRTRAVLGSAKWVLPDTVRESARDGFSWLTEHTGPPRDLDVYLLEWNNYTNPLGPEMVAALAPVRSILERRCAAAHTDLVRVMRSKRATELINDWSSWLAAPIDPHDHGDLGGRPVGRVVAKRITRAHDVLVERGRLIDPGSPAAQMHDLRKDAKRLRYLIECFGGLLTAAPRTSFVKPLKALQDNLGEHQDAEVHGDVLRAIGDELRDSGGSTDTSLAIGQLTERLDQQRLAARAEFHRRFADFDTTATQVALDTINDRLRR